MHTLFQGLLPHIFLRIPTLLWEEHKAPWLAPSAINQEKYFLFCHMEKKVIILYHQLPRKRILMITKDERHVKVKK